MERGAWWATAHRVQRVGHNGRVSTHARRPEKLEPNELLERIVGRWMGGNVVCELLEGLAHCHQIWAFSQSEMSSI